MKSYLYKLIAQYSQIERSSSYVTSERLKYEYLLAHLSGYLYELDSIEKLPIF